MSGLDSRKILTIRRYVTIALLVLFLALLQFPQTRSVLDEWFARNPGLNQIAMPAAVFLCSAVLLWLAQWKMKSEVAGVMAAIAAEVQPPPNVFLYLRSFEVGRSSLLSRVLINFTPWFWNRDYRRHDAEEELSQAIGRFGWLLAIGDKRVSYGAAKVVVSDDLWQERFFQLADTAHAIFMMPGPSEATLWEIEQMIGTDRYLRKSIFIMPREGTTDLSGGDGEYRSWQEAVGLISRSTGVLLPAYQGDGAYIRVLEDNTIEMTTLEAFTLALSRKMKRVPGGRAGQDQAWLDQVWRAASPAAAR